MVLYFFRQSWNAGGIFFIMMIIISVIMIITIMIIIVITIGLWYTQEL